MKKVRRNFLIQYAVTGAGEILKDGFDIKEFSIGGFVLTTPPGTQNIGIQLGGQSAVVVSVKDGQREVFIPYIAVPG